jgi:hypothetical protein
MMFSIFATTDKTQRRTMVQIRSESENAEVFEVEGERYVPRGVAPLSVPVEYTVEEAHGVGYYLAAIAGVGIDVLLTGYMVKSFREAAAGDRVLPGLGVGTMGAALLMDGLVLLSSDEKVTPRQMTFLAKAPGRRDAQKSVSVPEELSLVLNPEEGAVALTADDLRRRNTKKLSLGSVLVLNIKAGRGVQPDLESVVTNLTVSEVGSRLTGKVISLADVETLVSAEKAKDIVGCSEASCFAEIGGMLGSDQVVAGDVSQVGNYLVISLRLINSKRAAVTARISHRMKVAGSQEDALVAGLPEAVEGLLSQAAGTP